MLGEIVDRAIKQIPGFTDIAKNLGLDSEEEAPVGNVEFEGCEYYLNVMETKIKEKSVISRTMAPVSQKIREKEQEESLPSFLRGNLWIEMLSKRTD